MNLAFIVLVIVALLNGCVSIGYHQRKLNEAIRTERSTAVLLAEQVRDKRMTARDMIKVLNYINENCVDIRPGEFDCATPEGR